MEFGAQLYKWAILKIAWFAEPRAHVETSAQEEDSKFCRCTLTLALLEGMMLVDHLIETAPSRAPSLTTYLVQQALRRRYSCESCTLGTPDWKCR